MRQDKPLDVSACLESPERAIGLLNRVISSGGDLDAIKQAVGVVTAALESISIAPSRPRHAMPASALRARIR